MPPDRDVSIVRNATSADIEGVVSVHLEAFDTFFLTSLGPRFLSRLYAGYLAHPSGILLVTDGPYGNASSVAGFVAGTTDPPTFYSWLRRSRGIAMGLAAVPALVRRPRAVGRRLVSAVFYRGDASPTVASATLLASLGVDPASSGLGLGGMLTDAFVLRSRQLGRERIYLTTDAIGNERVLEFYRRHGFHETSLLDRADGRAMAVLVREPSSDTPDHGPDPLADTTRGSGDP